jgi:hypothetical protein
MFASISCRRFDLHTIALALDLAVFIAGIVTAITTDTVETTTITSTKLNPRLPFPLIK